MLLPSLMFALAPVANEPAAPAPTPAPAEAADSTPPEVDAPSETTPPEVASPEEESTPPDAGPPAPTASPSLRAQPLPSAPPRVDPTRIDRHAWRGRGFFQIHIAAMVPLGGTQPAAGTVASAGGGLQLGWRIRPMFGLAVGLTTFLHDHDERDAVDSVGNTVEVRDFGRMTVFDPLIARIWIPTHHRVEPRFDAAVLLGSYRPPFEGGAQLVSGARLGAGIDVWIGPSFSLDFGVDPRLLIVNGRAGATLQAGMGATVHW